MSGLGDAVLAHILMGAVVQVTENHTAIKEIREDMARVREVLEQLQADVAEIKVDVPRVLSKMQQLLDDMADGNVELSPDMQARVDAMRGDLAGLNASMDAMVPPASEPVPVEPTPEPSPEDRPNL